MSWKLEKLESGLADALYPGTQSVLLQCLFWKRKSVPAWFKYSGIIGAQYKFCLCSGVISSMRSKGGTQETTPIGGCMKHSPRICPLPQPPTPYTGCYKFPPVHLESPPSPLRNNSHCRPADTHFHKQMSNCLQGRASYLLQYLRIYFIFKRLLFLHWMVR